MTSLAEQVEAEQTSYENPEDPEPDEPTPDEPTPDEPEAVAEPAGPVIGPEEIAKAERARSSYRKKIGEILGADAVEHECLLCAGLGYLPAVPPPGVTFTIVEAEDGPALVADEPRQEPPYKASDTTETCPGCDGWGLTLTGAKTEGGRLWQCSTCSGSGFISKAGTPVAPAVAETYSSVPAAVPPPPPLDGPPDAWGRPSGHVHWGVPPSAIPG